MEKWSAIRGVCVQCDTRVLLDRPIGSAVRDDEYRTFVFERRVYANERTLHETVIGLGADRCDSVTPARKPNTFLLSFAHPPACFFQRINFDYGQAKRGRNDVSSFPGSLEWTGADRGNAHLREL